MLSLLMGSLVTRVNLPKKYPGQQESPVKDELLFPVHTWASVPFLTISHNSGAKRQHNQASHSLPEFCLACAALTKYLG